MIWLILLVAVVLVVLTTAAVLGRVDGSLGDATTTMSHEPLPQAPLTTADLEALRFDTAMRGYRMSEVDGVVARLGREIRELREELDRSRPVVLAGSDPGAADPGAPSSTAGPGDPVTDQS